VGRAQGQVCRLPRNPRHTDSICAAARGAVYFHNALLTSLPRHSAMRLFIGIPLSDGVAGEISRLIAILQPYAPDLRFAGPDSWHITLQFLGNSTPEQLDSLKSRLNQVRSAPVPIALGKFGLFDRAGIFFADVTLTTALMELQEQIVIATISCGFAAESRAFHPHVTLAREKGRGGTLRKLRAHLKFDLQFSRLVAQEFLLYESHLGSAGSCYKVLGRFPLSI
jgi:2'-5' RNA ligase